MPADPNQPPSLVLLVAQRANDLSERQQAEVDVDAFLHALPRRLRAIHSLAARQIHEVELRLLDFIVSRLLAVLYTRRVDLLVDYHGEDRVGAAAVLIHRRFAGDSVQTAALQPRLQLLRGRRLLAALVDHLAATLGVGDDVYDGFCRLVHFEEIVDVVSVHLQIVDCDQNGAARVLLLDLRFPDEELLDKTGDDADFSLI